MEFKSDTNRTVATAPAFPLKLRLGIRSRNHNLGVCLFLKKENALIKIKELVSN